MENLVKQDRIDGNFISMERPAEVGVAMGGEMRMMEAEMERKKEG